jgi:hypothetical protein
VKRSILLVIGALALIAVAVTGGTLLLTTTIPPHQPLPTTTALPTPDAWEPEPQPTGMFPSQRRADVLLDDDVLVTRDELVEYAEGNEWRVPSDQVQEWASLGSLMVQCMADAGFWYDPRVPPTVLNADEPDGWRAALGGSTGAGDAYRWQDAGCGGRAIHELGISS